jgi:hypothetical protein
MDTHHTFSNEGKGPDITLLQFIYTQGLFASFQDFLLGIRYFKISNVCGIEEPVNMFSQPEDRRLPIMAEVTPDAFKNR